MLDRCTLVNNTSDVGGSVIREASVTHSIVWNNQGATLGSGASATWSNVEGGAAGIGNIAAPPLLGVDGALLAGSPCIDAGDPAAPGDPDGSPRDLGALPWSWPSVGTQQCSAPVNSSGLIAHSGAFGTPNGSGGDLYLRATDLPPNMLMMFVMSTAPGSIPLGGGGNGVICLASPVGRFQSQALQADALGVASIAVDTQALPIPGGTASAGSTYWFQGWFRDLTPAGIPTSSVTTSISVDFQ